MKDWLHATKWEIEKMTLGEAMEIVEKQIRLGHTDSEFRPREHTVHAYEMVVEYARRYVEFVRTLAKLEPKQLKPILSYPTNHCKLYRCPTCSNPVKRRDKNCELCGQSLDWNL